MPEYINGNGRSGDESVTSVAGNNNFEERSEAAQEIISRKPTFIEKWAMLIFMAVLLSLLTATWFIKYPEVVTGKALLWGEKSPKEIISYRSGRLTKVFVKNNQPVKAGQIVAWLESSASTQEVIDLSQKIQKAIHDLKNNEALPASPLFNIPSYQLGELKPQYQEFINLLDARKKNPPSSSLEQIPLKLEEALYTLKGHIDNWLKQYTVQAPADGQVAFIASIQQDKYITQGTLLGYIIPDNDKYYAEIKISQKDLGKIDTGMNVQLRFDAYAYQENGIVYGKLTELSKIAVDSMFTGTVLLNNGLVTNQNKHIPFSTGLKAQAIIVTKDMRLLKRFYYKLVF